VAREESTPATICASFYDGVELLVGEPPNLRLPLQELEAGLSEDERANLSSEPKAASSFPLRTSPVQRGLYIGEPEGTFFSY